MELHESELILKCKNGNVEAFEELVLKYQRQIYTVAYRFMGNHEDASDLAQEAFIKAYKSIDRFRGESSLKTWLYHIVANVCRDELRKRKKGQVLSLDAPISTEEGEITRQTEDWTYAPDLIYESKEAQYFIQEAINQLTPEYKEVIILREIQGFSYEEIAQHLGCSLGTIKSRLNRARKAMRDLLIKRRELFVDQYRLKQVKGG
ncbi:MAG: RNA polymerase sigma factor [Zhaonellaceae bacterium]|nr:sigma-70 family RNA polymerase sigma factor [Clostridia bacterium]